MLVDDIRAFLRQTREAKGLTQAEVAEAVGLSQPGYSNIERGNVALAVRHLDRLADVLGIPRNELTARLLGLGNAVEQSLAQDPSLNKRDRHLLLVLYGEMTQRNSAAIVTMYDDSGGQD